MSNAVVLASPADVKAYALMAMEHGMSICPTVWHGKVTIDEWKHLAVNPTTEEMVDIWWEQCRRLEPDPNEPNHFWSGPPKAFCLILDGCRFQDGSRPWLLDGDNIEAVEHFKRLKIGSEIGAETVKGAHHWFRWKPTDEEYAQVGRVTDVLDSKKRKSQITFDVLTKGIAAVPPFGGKVWTSRPMWEDYQLIPEYHPLDVPGMREKLFSKRVGGKKSDQAHPLALGQMHEGDGRNVAIYRAVGSMIGSGAPKSNCDELAFYINHTYCVDPLPDEMVQSMVDRCWADHYGKSNVIAFLTPLEEQQGAEVLTTANSEPEPQHTGPTLAELAVRAPGVLGELVEYMANASSYFWPEFALAGALTLVGTILGHKVQTPTGLSTNVYCMAIGGSGIGKEAPRALMSKVLWAAGLEYMEGGEEFTSHAGVLRAVQNGPVMGFLDEIGTQIKKAKTPGGPATGLLATVTKLYSAAGSIYRGDNYGAQDRKKRVIHRPHLCLYGTTTPGQFYGNIKAEDFEDGFGCRWLYFEVDADKPPGNFQAKAEIPEDLLERIKKLASLGPKDWRKTSMTLPTEDDEAFEPPIPKPVTLRITPEAEKMLADYAEKCRGVYNAERKRRLMLAGMVNRAHEVACKLSAMAACAETLDAHRPIDVDHVQWAIDLAEAATLGFINKSLDQIASTPFEGWMQRCLRAFKRAFPEPLTKRDVTRNHLGDLKPKDVADVFEALIDRGFVMPLGPKDKRLNGKPAQGNWYLYIPQS